MIKITKENIRIAVRELQSDPRTLLTQADAGRKGTSFATIKNNASGYFGIGFQFRQWNDDTSCEHVFVTIPIRTGSGWRCSNIEIGDRHQLTYADIESALDQICVVS